MKNIWHLSTLGLSLAIAGTLAGCGGNNEGASNTSGDAPAATSEGENAPAAGAKQLKGAGATFPAPLYTRWFDSYQETAGVQIDYQAVGSGAGIKQLSNKTVDFGASDAPLGEKDLKGLTAPVTTIPTVGGAVVLAYNVPGAPADLKMTGEVVANIFLGKIKKWNDPAITAANPGAKLPDTNIVVSHRSDGSGTTNIFTNYLAAVSPEWKTKVGAGKSVEWPVGLGGKGSDGVSSTVKRSAGGFGYVELAYAKQNKLPYASIKNKDGQFVKPDVAGVTAAAEGALEAVKKDINAPIANASGAKVYPISGFTYIMVYTTSASPDKGTALKGFLKWAMTEGQKQAAELDYAPLPSAIVELNEKTIDTLK